MTTIAYKDGILAGDGRLTTDAHIWHDKCRKVFRLSDGTLYGSAGDDSTGHELMEALEKGELCPEIDGDVDAIRVTPKGVLYLWSAVAWMKWPEPFAAIGSGKSYALAVLRAGHSAADAVKAGIAGNAYSGGRITKVTLRKNARTPHNKRERTKQPSAGSNGAKEPPAGDA